MRLFSRSTAQTRSSRSTHRLWGRANCPGPVPADPHEWSNFPASEMRWMRYWPYPSETYRSPEGPRIALVGRLKGWSGAPGTPRRAPRVDHLPPRTEAADRVVVAVGRVHPVLAVDPQEVGVPQQAGAPGVDVGPGAVVDQQGGGMPAAHEDPALAVGGHPGHDARPWGGPGGPGPSLRRFRIDR